MPLPGTGSALIPQLVDKCCGSRPGDVEGGAGLARVRRSAGRIWTAVRADLQEDPRVSPQQMAFVRLVPPVGLIDDTALFAVPDELTKQMFESRLREPIAELLERPVRRSPVRLAVTVDPDAAAGPGRGRRPRASDLRERRRALRRRGRRRRRPSRWARPPRRPAPPVRATPSAASSPPG